MVLRSMREKEGKKRRKKKVAREKMMWKIVDKSLLFLQNMVLRTA